MRISYGSGAVIGSLSADTVIMGGFTVPSQTFREFLSTWIYGRLTQGHIFMIVSATRLTPDIIGGGVSGIMGLAFSTIAITQSTPFWQTLANTGQLSSSDMGFWLKRDTSPSQSDQTPGGVFTLGGTNSSLFVGDIDFNDIPVSTPTYWLQTVSGKFYIVIIVVFM